MQRLNLHQLNSLLQALSESEEIHVQLSPQGELSWCDEGYSYQLQLPPVLPTPEEGLSLDSYLQNLPPELSTYAIILIRAGSASLAYFEGEQLIAHKVIRKYMVRKKQGKMQLSYLNQKGKSRAGSRIRLRESLEFFEEINDKLEEWFEDHEAPERIFYSCPVRLMSPWFASRIVPPFTKADPRLSRIPYHVHQPTHKELLRIHRLLSSAQLQTDAMDED